MELWHFEAKALRLSWACLLNLKIAKRTEANLWNCSLCNFMSCCAKTNLLNDFVSEYYCIRTQLLKNFVSGLNEARTELFESSVWPIYQVRSNPSIDPFLFSEEVCPNEICQPLLARGIKAAGFFIVRFLIIIGHAFNYQASAVMLLEGRNRWKIPLADPLLEIRFHTNNPLIFKPVFKAQETRKTAPMASKNDKR